MPLSLPLFIRQPVPWEAEWHGKVEGKDAVYNRRASPWLVVVIIRITPGCLRKRRDRAIIILERAARVCTCVCVHVHVCVPARAHACVYFRVVPGARNYVSQGINQALE